MKGIKVAQQGVDVEIATDYQLVMSSEWATLSIIAQGSFTVPGTGAINDKVVINQHNLGYLPAFLIFDNSAYNPTKTVNQAGQSELYNGVGIYTDNNQLVAYNDGIRGMSVPFTGYYIIFKQDLNEVVNPTLERPTQVTGGHTSNFGIKVAKKHQTLAESDTESNLHPMIIHVQGQANNFSEPPGFTIVHNLGYAPVFYIWSLAGINVPPNTASLVQFRATASPATITVRGVQSSLTQPVAFIVLKDPLLGGN